MISELSSDKLSLLHAPHDVVTIPGEGDFLDKKPPPWTLNDSSFSSTVAMLELRKSPYPSASKEFLEDL